VTRTQVLGAALLATILGAAAAAPVLAPNPPDQQFPDMAFAPPMPPRLVGADGVRRPFIHPLRVTDRVLGTYVEETSRPVTLDFFNSGRLVTAPGAAWLPLGGDPSGRDAFARLLDGARRSLGVAAVAVLLTLLLGTLAGALAGYAGGATDTAITSIADFVLVLPVLYAVVTLRAAMPIVLSPATVFWTMAIVMAAASWPVPARVVRAVVATERTRGYAEAAYAAGAGPWQILHRHVMPAVMPQVALQGLLLFPAFIFAEATLSSAWALRNQRPAGGRCSRRRPGSRSWRTTRGCWPRQRRSS
jgi:ABC-type dipeptide/oligopeptide/nickel transport system permease subunit